MLGRSEDFSRSRTLQADFSATGGPATLQSAVAREVAVHEFCQRIMCRCEDATMGASTFDCLWFYSGNREEETYYAGRSRTVIEFGKNNRKRKPAMAECDWEACGPITHRSTITKIVEAAEFPRSKKDMSSMEWQHR